MYLCSHLAILSLKLLPVLLKKKGQEHKNPTFFFRAIFKNSCRNSGLFILLDGAAKPRVCVSRRESLNVNLCSGSTKFPVCFCSFWLLLSILSFSRTMANLYRDAYWSQKDLDSHIGEAQKQATKCKMGCFSMDRMKYYNKQLCQRKEEGYRTSFIDLWGLMIEYLLNDGVCCIFHFLKNHVFFP